MRSLIFNCLFYSLSFLVALACWLVAAVGSAQALRKLLLFWTRMVRVLVRVVLGGRIEVLGWERLPEGGPTLLVSKHQSELDAIMMFALFPDLGAVVMKELERYPFVGAMIRKLDFITVAVDQGPQGRTQAVVDGAARVLAQGRPVLIYPEGTLMSLGAKERYRSGAWRIYAASGCAATPVAQSVGAIWPRREWTKRTGGTGAVEFLDPIPPGLDQETFMAEVEARIESATMALIRAHAAPQDLAEAERRHAAGIANED